MSSRLAVLLFASSRCKLRRDMSELRIPRRAALLGALSTLAVACRSNKERAAQVEPIEEEPSIELQFFVGGDLEEHERAGTLLVLLHGFGASADDLNDVADSLAMVHPGTRYVLCAGPFQTSNGGRAWWPMREHPHYDQKQVLSTPERELRSARNAVLELLRKLRQRYAPQKVALVGFSQGAMLALDVALTPSAGVARVAVLSGALVADTMQRLAHDHATPAVFVMHGRTDAVLTFQGATQLVTTLKEHHIEPRFLPFDGGHEIPRKLIPGLAEFLFAS